MTLGHVGQETVTQAVVTADEIYARLDQAVRQRDAAWERLDAVKAEFDSVPWWRFIRKEILRDAVLKEAMTMRYWNDMVGERIAQCEVLEAVGK